MDNNMRTYKYKLLLTGILFFQGIISAQIVVTVPPYPTQNDSIIIHFDATQPGAEELLNYTGTVYAHTGVNTNLGVWRYVKGSWGNNQTQPALTRLGANLYQLTIGYPRSFYNVTNPSENILALALVFRSADATKQTRPDIFAAIFEPGVTIVINSPNVTNNYGNPLRSPAFAFPDDTLQIDLTVVEIGTLVSDFSLYINNMPVAQTGSNHISYEFIAAQYSNGGNEVLAVAVDTAGSTDSSRFVIFINPPVEDAQLPQGIIHGINYENSTTVTLALFAPYKEFVYAVGDFNDWKVDTDYYLKRHVIDNDNVVWWTTISGLIPGEEYAFQYLVDGDLRIADPYTDKVLDPWNDQYISSSTYPNLKPYPAGKTSEIVSILQTNQQPYQWQVNDFQKPAVTDLVIYELLLRDFVATHDYKTLEDTLSYLKTLGVNAIELMPVMEFEGNISWGYNPSFHFAVDKYYGPKNDLKKFIDKAHEMGIAVILDIVLNHVYGQSPLVRLYWDPFNNRPAPNSPWFNVVSPNPVYYWGNDFNHESQATKDYVDRVNRYWLEEYKVDGFRFDFTKGFTNTPGDGWAFDQARINILERMADKIWEYDENAYVILEHLTANSEETILAYYGMMLWGNMNGQYSEAAMGYNSNLTDASYKSRGWNIPHLVSYMESHDEERIMYKNLQFGNSYGNYNIRNLTTALERMKLAGTFYFLIPGPKMIWQFGELGYDYSINYPCGTSLCRLDPKPIRWDYKNDYRRLNLYKVFSHLINLKKEYDAFRSTDFSMFVSTYSKRININHTSMNVTIIGNFSVVATNNNPNFQSTGWWYDYFSGDSIFVTNTQENILLGPGDFNIYTSVKLPTPEPGLVNVELIDDIIVDEFYLEQNYPNPFNPSTNIEFKIKETGFVTLKVFDLPGREVKTLVNDELTNGVYRVSWNGDNESGNKVSSGVYFYKLFVNGNGSTGNYSDSRKMILLK
jgi:1,4-alpha-glucan branching enzyme